jgi:hypothetical protein
MSMTASEMARRRWAGVSKEEHSEIASKGGEAAWADWTPEERSEEMRKRAEKRHKLLKKRPSKRAKKSTDLS